MNEPHIDLTGHLGADPTLRTTPNGVAVTDLRIATTRRYKVGEEWRDGETMWFEVAVWKQLAENVCATLKKGDKVCVSGRLLQRSWTREDGSVGASLVIDATAVGLDLGRSPAAVRRPMREGSAAAVLEERWQGAPETSSASSPVEELPAEIAA
jgi:single-strand DNA-binding protein